MRLFKTLILLLALIISSYHVAFASRASDGQYQFVVNLPQGHRWGIVTNDHDAGGYTKVYAPSFTWSGLSQRLMEGFSFGDKTPLRDAMQVVVNQHKGIPCRKNNIHVISSDEHMVLYTATLAQCDNGQSLFQIFKSFNMPDGNYTIAYAANPDTVPQTTLDAMTTAIKSAYLQ